MWCANVTSSKEFTQHIEAPPVTKFCTTVLRTRQCGRNMQRNNVRFLPWTATCSVQLQKPPHIPPCTGISYQTSNMSSFEWQHLKSEDRIVKYDWHDIHTSWEIPHSEPCADVFSKIAAMGLGICDRWIAGGNVLIINYLVCCQYRMTGWWLPWLLSKLS